MPDLSIAVAEIGSRECALDGDGRYFARGTVAAVTKSETASRSVYISPIAQSRATTDCVSDLWVRKRRHIAVPAPGRLLPRKA